jgi:predicted signal transduction protein with EAL and GGDEF domain
MTAVVRPGDTVCRLGGDEFVVVIEPVGTTGSVVEIAERVAASLAEPMTYGDDIIVTGGSVGIAISDGRSDADSLLREADSAMYLAKATARGGVEIFNDALRAGLQAEAEFRIAMADALVKGELELHYQPVLDIAAGRPTAFEALARWHRPGFGLIAPDQFIPMAEKSGLIIEIGQWALHAATAQLAAWSADPAYASMKVAVNLSGRHVAQAGVVDDVRAALTVSGLAPERLIIEITESIAIDSAATIDHLIGLSELGVLIALDDFGTGYTSIGQLLHLPVHILKIDRSLISGTNEDGTAALEQTSRIVELIVEVAHSLGFEVVAEGVEETAELATLVNVSCDSAQGYLFSRPLPADQVGAWVTAHDAQRGRDAMIVVP